MDRARGQWMRLVMIVAVAILFGWVVGGAWAQEEDGSVFAENVVTTTVAVDANLRAEPGIEAKVIQVLPAGTLVGFTGFTDGSGDWIQVDPVDAPLGWMHRTVLMSVPDGLQVRPEDVSGDLALEQEGADDFAENVVTGETRFRVYLRSSPAQQFNIIETLEVGTVVGFTGFTDAGGEWVQVDPIGAPVGWVWAEFLSNVPAGLQVRPEDLPEEPEDVTNNEEALADEEEDAEFAANIVTTMTTVNANLREAPGVDAEIIQVLPAGTVVGFTGFTDANRAWIQVDPLGDAPVGWVHATLLGFVPEGLQVADID